MSYKTYGIQTNPIAHLEMHSPKDSLPPGLCPAFSFHALKQTLWDPKDFPEEKGKYLVYTWYMPLCHLLKACRLCIKCQLITKLQTISDAGEEN